MKIRILIATLLLGLTSGCTTPTGVEQSGQDGFFNALAGHCGKAYAGRLMSDQEADAEMRGQPMLMHVRECSADRIAIPFHIQNADGSWNRSRTWLVMRTGSGLRLKHDHRHEDGTSDRVTLYGGDTAAPGTAQAQDFPVDAESIAMFVANGLPASVTNVWRVELSAAGSEDARFVYQLSRANRLFRVEFDLTKTVPPPPAPWGLR